MRLDLLDGVRGDAWLSDDRVYRYMLTRTWAPTDGRNSVLWIMLNPSVGNADEDDRTLRRCQAFARSWGYDGIAVVNLFALRTPYPAALRSHADPVGPENDVFLASLLTPNCEGVRLVVAAWGTHGGIRDRAARVIARAHEVGRPLHALWINDDGSPKHPLYVKGETEPVVYRDAP